MIPDEFATGAPWAFIIILSIKGRNNRTFSDGSSKKKLTATLSHNCLFIHNAKYFTGIFFSYHF